LTSKTSRFANCFITFRTYRNFSESDRFDTQDTVAYIRNRVCADAALATGVGAGRPGLTAPSAEHYQQPQSRAVPSNSTAQVYACNDREESQEYVRPHRTTCQVRTASTSAGNTRLPVEKITCSPFVGCVLDRMFEVCLIGSSLSVFHQPERIGRNGNDDVIRPFYRPTARRNSPPSRMISSREAIGRLPTTS